MIYQMLIYKGCFIYRRINIYFFIYSNIMPKKRKIRSRKVSKRKYRKSSRKYRKSSRGVSKRGGRNYLKGGSASAQPYATAICNWMNSNGLDKSLDTTQFNKVHFVLTAASGVIFPGPGSHQEKVNETLDGAVEAAGGIVAYTAHIKGSNFSLASLLTLEGVDLDVRSAEQYEGPGAYDVSVIHGVDVDMSAPGNYLLVNPPPGAVIQHKRRLSRPQIGRVDRNHPITRGLEIVDAAIVVSLTAAF